MLHAILQSTNTIVMAVSRVEGGGGGGGSAVMEGENREQAIRSMVDSAFRNCDITGTGKLLPLVHPSQHYLIDCVYTCMSPNCCAERFCDYALVEVLQSMLQT